MLTIRFLAGREESRYEVWLRIRRAVFLSALSVESRTREVAGVRTETALTPHSSSLTPHSSSLTPQPTGVRACPENCRADSLP